jgi:hypothetical protein
MIQKAGILCLALSLALCARGADAAPTRREALDAISVLERTVTGPGAAEAAKTIVVYAQLSDDVLVNIGNEQLPWLAENWPIGREQVQSCQSVLMAAFVAGNIRSQLRSGRAEDDTYSGWLFAIDAYRRLSANFGFRSQAIEALAKMQQDGTLQQHAKDLDAEEREDPADAQRRPVALEGPRAGARLLTS